ncbi:hypothetical protein J6590_066834 [Homalodisca vitripennis]|nr:hypothetical protein J6590_066834 [Homalodisca vitripennis]
MVEYTSIIKRLNPHTAVEAVVGPSGISPTSIRNLADYLIHYLEIRRNDLHYFCVNGRLNPQPTQRWRLYVVVCGASDRQPVLGIIYQEICSQDLMVNQAIMRSNVLVYDDVNGVNRVYFDRRFRIC